MSTRQLATKTVIAGVLSLTLGACGNSTPGTAGSGGAINAGSGGTTESGGTISTGGSATGGTTSTTTTAPATGGISGSGGATAAGGTTMAAGGQPAGDGGRAGGAGGRAGGATGTATTGTGGLPTGGTLGSGGADGGTTTVTGGATTGGRGGAGGSTASAAGGTASGGATATGTGGVTGTGGGTGTSTGTCTASKAASVNVSGTGPHKVVVESNTDSAISCGTIYRPADLGGTEKYPIFVWGEGGCSRSGTSNQAAMGEIASHGYFVVADGPTGGGGSNCGTISMPSSAADLPNMAKPLLGYIGWAIAENDKPCSAYYQSIDTTKIAADGFSCGGLMAEGTAGDSRMTTWGITSSGMTSADATFYKTIHTPVKILLGGSGDVAYTNGERDYTNISALGIPIILLSKDGAGHGGDLSKGTGDFNTVNLAWLNWQLKGDTGATGKGLLVGASCKYCNASGWEFKSANLQ